MFFSSPLFFDDLEEDQKQTESLGRSDTDRESIRQWETKVLLISCSDRSNNLTCEYRLAEMKQRLWRWPGSAAVDVGDHLPSDTFETCSLLLSV